jgi:peptidoglycan/LPS O-acetylase OafA/YrhL
VTGRRVTWWIAVLLASAATLQWLLTGLDSPSYDQVVWRPTALGALCFLIGALLLLPERTPEHPAPQRPPTPG